MEQWIFQIIVPVITAFCGWLFSKLHTRREQKQTDLQIINSAISPLLESISELTERLKTTTTELLQEKEKNLQLTTERTELLEKIDKLEKEVKKLQRQVAKISKNEKDNPDTPAADE